MPKLTTPQIFAIILATLGVLGVSTAQLTDLFGAQATKYIVSASSLFTSILSGWLAIITGQNYQIQAVAKMVNDPTSPVQGVITTDTPAGKALAKSMPGAIGAAGSNTATELAKP